MGSHRVALSGIPTEYNVDLKELGIVLNCDVTRETSRVVEFSSLP